MSVFLCALSNNPSSVVPVLLLRSARHAGVQHHPVQTGSESRGAGPQSRPVAARAEFYVWDNVSIVLHVEKQVRQVKTHTHTHTHTYGLCLHYYSDYP